MDKRKTDKISLRREKIFADPKYLMKKIEGYFRECDRRAPSNCLNCKNFSEDNKCCSCRKNFPKPYTLAGLCLYLGIGIGEFSDLKKNKCFKSAVDFALLKIREYIEENCVLGNISPTFASAVLKGELYPQSMSDASDENGDADNTLEIVLAGELRELAK